MTIKLRTNLISGIIFLVFSIILLFIIPKEIVQTYTQNQYIDADTIPKLIGYFMMGVSIYLILKGTILKKEVIKEIELAPEIVSLGFIFILAIYVAIIPFVGFLIASLLLGGVCLAIEKVNNWKVWLLVFGVIVLIYFGFEKGLGLTFPNLYFLG